MNETACVHTLTDLEFAQHRQIPVPLHFHYRPQRYFFGVIMPLVFAGVLIPLSLVGYFGWNWGVLALAGLIVALYIIINTLIARAYPRVVEIRSDALVFTSFARTDTWRFEDITSLQVRERPASLSLYIRINKGGFDKGRYFLECKDFEADKECTGEVLYQLILALQEHIDPEHMRVVSRRASRR